MEAREVKVSKTVPLSSLNRLVGALCVEGARFEASFLQGSEGLPVIEKLADVVTEFAPTEYVMSAVSVPDTALCLIIALLF